MTTSVLTGSNKLFTVAEVAELKGVTRMAVRKAIGKELMPQLTVGGSAVFLFDEPCVKRYLSVHSGRPKTRK